MASKPNSKRTIYVGGLAEEVNEKVLNAAFVPFGDLVDVQIPLDYETEKHRGFAFIEFENAEDAAAAIDNMVCITPTSYESLALSVSCNFCRKGCILFYLLFFISSCFNCY